MDNASEEGKRTGISTFGCAAIVFAIIALALYVIFMVICFTPVTKTGAGQIQLVVSSNWDYEVVASDPVTDIVDSLGYFEFRNSNGEATIFGREQTDHRPLGSEKYYLGSKQANGSWQNSNASSAPTYHEFEGETPYKVTTWAQNNHLWNAIFGYFVATAVAYVLIMIIIAASIPDERRGE